MRLVLPTGVDGAEREYALDHVADRGLVTLDQMLELTRATGVSLLAVYRGFQFLPSIANVSNDDVVLAISENPELMAAYRGLIWLARHRAGDRGPDGLPLTAAQSVDFPFQKIRIVTEPGDEVPDDEDDADPQTPSTDGAPATDDGAPKTQTRGRSAKTSETKS